VRLQGDVRSRGRGLGSLDEQLVELRSVQGVQNSACECWIDLRSLFPLAHPSARNSEKSSEPVGTQAWLVAQRPKRASVMEAEHYGGGFHVGIL
jgi:hypothetical protein